MPASRSWSEVSENRASQVGILALCCDMLRPIRVRKVWGSGTKGVGRGIRAGVMFACRQRNWVLRKDVGVGIAVTVVSGRRENIVPILEGVMWVVVWRWQSGFTLGAVERVLQRSVEMVCRLTCTFRES